MPAGRLTAAVWAAKTSDARLFCLDDFALFDLYRPQGGEKSLAFEVRLVSGGDEQLTDEQTEAACQAILDALGREGATLRA